MLVNFLAFYVKCIKQIQLHLAYLEFCIYMFHNGANENNGQVFSAAKNVVDVVVMQSLYTKGS